ncbi:MAG: hypothetical protein IJ956_01015 [Akkermansia sp.]|nr:hypothetical protein [Akkermansia sp.]
MKKLFTQKQPLIAQIQTVSKDAEQINKTFNASPAKAGWKVTASVNTGGVVLGVGAQGHVCYEHGRGVRAPQITPSLTPAPKVAIEASLPISRSSRTQSEIRARIEKSSGKKPQAEIRYNIRRDF